MPHYINLQQVCTMTVNAKKRVGSINYQEFSGYYGFFDWIMSLFGKTKPKVKVLVKHSYNGDYVLEGDNLKTELKEESAFIDENDNQMYHYPFVDMRLSNQNTRTKWFDTVEEMNAWVEETNTKVPTIVLLKK